MSRRNLYNKITSLTGLKPNEFIRLVRLKQAARFLKESQLTVSQICFQVGFNHMSSFHKYFKLQFGVSPGSFREQV
jgi:AraC-like DNA-binding protein